MDYNKKEYEIGSNALVGWAIAVVTTGIVFLGTQLINYRKKTRMIDAGIPIKDNSEMTLEYDPKTKKAKLDRKTSFEMEGTTTIIKEVPVVPGFKKTKKVQVQKDKNGNEIPGTEKDVVE